jgi:adenine-specific DNA-methyltransferase
MASLLSDTQQLRMDFSGVTTRSQKSALGQFMTPAPVARFMSSLFRPAKGALRFLEPGAGLGALATATLERWKSGELGRGRIEMVAHELDERLLPRLENALAPFASDGAAVRVVGGDYLGRAADAIEAGARRFTHAILNPPYKKIASSSEARHTCRRVGLETVNLYSAFVGLALCQLAPKGQLVAIIPRSFCNGPYYRPFRDFVFTRAALHHIHLFDRRDQAFSDDDVLQENVIILLERDGVQGDVRITGSTDGTFADLRGRSVPFAEVIKPDDAEGFIHIPASDEIDHLENASSIRYTLHDLHIEVSTGPVVDFRLREHLVAMPRRGTVPLLYPVHLTGGEVTWPIQGSKKANAITRNADTERWLFPVGAYTVVRRFSSKEERRRVVASLVLPDSFNEHTAIGFENHLNVFHQRKAGLPVHLAWGLQAYLTCSAVDRHFRRFNGHTQVNATDLRALRYPSIEALTALGKWAESATSVEQSAIDRRMRTLLA